MGGILSGIGNMYSSFYGNKQLQSDYLNWQEDMMDEQRAAMEEMFPLIGALQDLGMNLYTGEGAARIEDFLLNPMPPSNLQRQLFEFFGGTQPVKGYYRGAVTGGKKGGPGARQNRLLGRYGAPESGPLAGMGQQLFESAMANLEGLVPYGQELAETGFLTDIQPIEDYAMRMFERRMMPEAAERFGANLTGSGYQQEMGRTMGDLAAELGAMQVQLQEAATNRRMQGLSGIVQDILTGPMNLATAYANAAAQAGQQYVNAVNQARPGYGLLQMMPAFANAASSQGFIQQGFPTGGTPSELMSSALGQTAGSALGQIGNLLGQIDWGGNQGEGEKIGMGWDMGSMGGTDLGNQMPWLEGGGAGGGGDTTSVVGGGSWWNW